MMRSSSSESPKGITSSARECRITVPGFTVLADPHWFHAGQSRTSRASPLLMFIATAPPARSDDHIGLVLVELVLGDLDGLLWELGIEDRVAVVLEKGRFDAARN